MGGCYTGVDAVTGGLIARRRSFERVRPPPPGASAAHAPRRSPRVCGRCASRRTASRRSPNARTT